MALKLEENNRRWTLIDDRGFIIVITRNKRVIYNIMEENK